MNMSLEPTLLQQQLSLNMMLSNIRDYWIANINLGMKELFVNTVAQVAPDLFYKIQTDLTNYSYTDLNSIEGLNTFLRMNLLSFPAETSSLRTYLINVDYETWLHYFVNVLLFPFIELYRNYVT